MTSITRHFIAVGDRRVHYRRCGEGPPVIMLHGSPGNSEMMTGEIAALAADFTCIALDTPGFGLSDPLPGEAITIADLADATAAAIRALALAPVRIFGTHTGAAIGLEMGARHPDLASGLVLDGVPIFDDAEMATLFQDYFAPLVVDPLAGHLTATWMRFRDQHTWFPWNARHVDRLNAIARPTPADIHLWVMMFYRSSRSYASAYRSATFYGQGAVRAATALTRPAMFMATAEDMLFGHLDRLPPLRADQRIAQLPGNFAAKCAAIGAALADLPGGSAVPATPPDFAAGRQFFDTPGGEIFVRSYGATDAPALFLLHDAPGSGHALEDLATALSVGARVLLPDLPGCGESTIRGADPLQAAADAVQGIADRIGLARFAVHGIGCGASVAAVLAGRQDARLADITLAGVPLPDATIVASIAPDLPLDPAGAHWLRAWLMVRDAQIYAPWYDGSIAAQRSSQGNFDADWLHAMTFEIMKARTTYHRLPRAAFGYDPRPALANATVPIRLATAPDHPLAGNDAATLAALPGIRRGAAEATPLPYPQEIFV